MVQRVLVAVDGTKASNSVLEIACALADKYEAALGLLSVVDEDNVTDELLRAAEVEGVIPDSTGYGTFYDTSLADYRTAEAYTSTLHAQQAELVSRLVSETIVEEAAAFSSESPFRAIKTFVRSGDPADAILNVAAQFNVDIIMMGHDQQGRIEGLLKGSVAEKVQRKATCPVLIYCLPK